MFVSKIPNYYQGPQFPNHPNTFGNMSNMFEPHLASLELNKWPRVYIPPLNVLWNFYRQENKNGKNSLRYFRNISF